MVNDPVVNKNNYTTATWLFTTEPKMYGIIPGCANPTGFALFTILFIMFICSQPFVRRGGSFEVRTSLSSTPLSNPPLLLQIFYWTHLLYIPFWVLCLFHGPNFYKWFIVPGVMFLVERILRVLWLRSERGKTYISSGILLPSKVTHLVIKRPLHFCFRPGDYVFVNIPAIAKYEWHPFTLSSAPEEEDYIWLHIRGVGEWTNRLYDYFEKEHKRLQNGEVPAVISGCSSASANGSASEEGRSKRDILSQSDKFNEHVTAISANSNSPDKTTESKISPLVTHSNNGKATGSPDASPIKKIQA